MAADRQPRIGAVVLLYRYWPEVSAALDGLQNQSLPLAEIVVVDNDPAGGAPDGLRRLFPGVAVIESENNGGYAAGMNLGVAYLRRRHIHAALLLTHDCVLAPDAVERLAARLDEAPGVGVVGPLTAWRSHPDRVFSAGCHIDHRSGAVANVATPEAVTDWHGKGACQREWLGGYCLLIRDQVLAAAGPMDEQYFMYFEEVDYLLHVGQLGWGIECVPAALAWQTPGVIPLELWTRNHLRVLARRVGASVVVRRTARELLDALRDARSGELARTTARLRGIWRFCRRRWGPIPTPDGASRLVAR